MDPSVPHPDLMVGEKRPSDSPNHDGSEHNAASRRKTRLVSDMDEEQLRRKRQTDRKAQEAMRLRTKSRIMSLETELESVKAAAGQREQELQMQVHALREENAMLHARLEQRTQANGDGGAHPVSTAEQADPMAFRPYSEQSQVDPKVTPHSVLANFCDYYSTEQPSGQGAPPYGGATAREPAMHPHVPTAPMNVGGQTTEGSGMSNGEDAKASHSWPGLASEEERRPA
ncbi:hypothetical protein Tdes44962_MAKER06782 [Teratosphaeria destructans]|uniref:BZIP domain-containing protein n=1 Tax=Teratosphaeria destructans TaxID=418781 RepID=A0A9W7W6P2_9PEZI|nr:hypothetical protein Tdes44962_MAKER06782 [Teratosphaeria destructans]